MLAPVEHIPSYSPKKSRPRHNWLIQQRQRLMSIEKQYELAFVSSLALREKQIQQNYRPYIAVHKWFARRPGTLFRSLILSEFHKGKLSDQFFKPTRLPGIAIADPFMGGGTPLVEANRVGAEVHGFDINPMSWWIVKEELTHLPLDEYKNAVQQLTDALREEVGSLYKTQCTICGNTDADAKYFLWVKRHTCEECQHEFDLMPGYLISEDKRHPRNVIACSTCGELNEVANRKELGHCKACSSTLLLNGPASRGRISCPQCGHKNRYPNRTNDYSKHRLIAIEYFCRSCKPTHQGRFFKKPDPADLGLYADAAARCTRSKMLHVPEDQIPAGDETNRLLNWGFSHYADLFNPRQLLGLNSCCALISKIADKRVRDALATNLSDLLRYQNMLCRYDTMALKSLDVFSVHGFPVSLVQCESNLLGILSGNGSTPIGSGGLLNITEKYTKAKAYCDQPFEIRHDNERKQVVPMSPEWIGEHRNGALAPESRRLSISCMSSTCSSLPPRSVDAVFTDPPYYGNVQYAELMDFCYAWLRKLVGKDYPEFSSKSTRNPGELTGNITSERGLPHFTAGLSEVFRRMAEALKPGGPLVFTYHHNSLSAYSPIGVAILNSGLFCSASIPCPAEMGASIHISGTGSSVVDTVFVCRSTGSTRRNWFDVSQLPDVIAGELREMASGGLRPTSGDIRCIAYGHLTRLAIFRLRSCWNSGADVEAQLCAFDDECRKLPQLEEIHEAVVRKYGLIRQSQSAYVFEESQRYGENDEFITF